MKKKFQKIIPAGAAIWTLAALAAIGGAINDWAKFDAQKKQAIAADAGRTIVDDQISLPESTAQNMREKLIDSCAKLVRKSTGDAYAFTSSADIGRAAYNDIVISDIHVSRIHCRVFLKNGHYYITDLNASTKAKLNGKPVDNFNEDIYKYMLNDDDIITIGSETFIFYLPNSDDPSINTIKNIDVTATIIS